MDTFSARALLTEAVDYAGLFPPAALSMPDAVVEFVTAQQSAEAWMLGRFVLTAAQLPECAAALGRVGPPAREVRLSAIVRDGSEDDVASIARFAADALQHGARVDAIECKPRSLEGVDWLAEHLASAGSVYVEVDLGEETRQWLEAVAARGLRAKVRTGGLSPAAFPAPDALLTFIATAVALRLPFKATAGLHHAVRGSYPLTYEADTAKATMHGFLNVLLATTAIRAGLPRDVADDLLRETDIAAFTFGARGMRWRDLELPTSLLEATRREQMVSFGSCSFREPAADFHVLSRAAAQTTPA